MTNKTFIPAFKASVGEWEYYICIMKYAEVARQVEFAHDLNSNSDLSEMIQRGISERTSDIRRYLLESEHRFLGAIIVAAWGGEPTYLPVTMEDPDGMLSGIDRQFGVLTFDGTQSYFALDGQHRLKAIKESIKIKPELGKDDICVIMVSHYQTDEGKVRTRRLFTNINRNAKITTSAENIVLDEDDGAAILTRRLLTDHPFLSQEGIVKVFIRQGEGGDIKLAGASVPQGDKKAFTTIAVLYDIVRILSFDLDPSMRTRDARPSGDVLESSYSIISQRMDDFIASTGNVRTPLVAGENARNLRAKKGQEAEGSPIMRPVIQKAVAKVAAEIAQQGVLEWSEVMGRLAKLDWHIGQAPWISVFNTNGSKMVTAKENADLLRNMLYVHLAAPSKQAITRARKSFRDIKGSAYPISEDALLQQLTPHAEEKIDGPELITEDVSEEAEIDTSEA